PAHPQLPPFPTRRSSDLKGTSAVLLEYWAVNCGPCKAWRPYFEALKSKFPGRNFVVLSVNDGDPAADVAEYLRKYPTSLTTVLEDRKSTRLNSSHLVISY